MIGFVYLWMDSGRHSVGHPNLRVFCLGSHRGSENDRYTTSTGGARFKNALKKRPQDFKRRIIERIHEGDSRTVLEAEQRWLNLIRLEELYHRYYNQKKTAAGLSSEDLLRLHAEDPTIGKRIGRGIRTAHESDPNLRKRMGAAISAAYAANLEFGKNKSDTMRVLHEADPELKQRIGKGVMAAYAADQEMGKRAGAARRAAYAANPELGLRLGNAIREAHKRDPSIGKRQGDSHRANYAADPTIIERIAEGVRSAHRADPELKVRMGAGIRAAHKADPTIGQRIGAGVRAFRTGTRWINNGIKRRQLIPGEPIPEGWFLGYKLEPPTPPPW